MPNVDDRVVLMNLWNAFCVLVAIWFLSNSFWKAAVVFVFFFVSSALGYGARWLSRLGFAVSLVALAIFLGAPPIERWMEFAGGLPEAVARLAALRE